MAAQAQVYVNQSTRGRQTHEYIAHLAGVQTEVRLSATEIGIDAEGLLMDHHVENVAHIEITQAKREIDRFVCLVDSNDSNTKDENNNSALAIEFGRAGYIDHDGKLWGESDGLYILTQAAGVKRRHGPKGRPKRRDRPTRGARGRFT